MSEESIKAQQEALKDKEDWRQQYLDERNSKREAALKRDLIDFSRVTHKIYLHLI